MALMSDTNFNKVLVVLNPISGGIEKKEANELFDLLAKKFNVEQEIFRTRGKDDVKRLNEYIADFNPDVVFAGGGDGTINLVGRCLLKKNIPLGIIPLGSANGLATELEIPPDIEEAYLIAMTGKPFPIDVLEVNNDYISLHLSDIGFNANLIRRFEAEEERGKFAYVKQFFKEYLVNKPSRYTFTYNGNTFSRKALMVVFANATKFGTGAIINPKGKLNDGKFETCIIKPYPWHAIFGIAASFFFGNIDKSKYVKMLSCKNITVKMKKAQAIQVDGEIIGFFKKVTARILPEKIYVMKPE
jgi:diacylglycerol kinase (ATP)